MDDIDPCIVFKLEKSFAENSSERITPDQNSFDPENVVQEMIMYHEYQDFLNWASEFLNDIHKCCKLWPEKIFTTGKPDYLNPNIPYNYFHHRFFFFFGPKEIASFFYISRYGENPENRLLEYYNLSKKLSVESRMVDFRIVEKENITEFSTEVIFSIKNKISQEI